MQIQVNGRTQHCYNDGHMVVVVDVSNLLPPSLPPSGGFRGSGHQDITLSNRNTLSYNLLHDISY